MTLYLIRAKVGVDPILTADKSQGFIEASSKAKAIAQATRSLPYTYQRLEALTMSEVGERVWEIEQEMFPVLPRFCEYKYGNYLCRNQLHKTNKSGYCQQHTEHAPHRRTRKSHKDRQDSN